MRRSRDVWGTFAMSMACQCDVMQAAAAAATTSAAELDAHRERLFRFDFKLTNFCWRSCVKKRS